MKIKNLSSQDLKLPMKKKNGQKTIVTLTPGQIVYSESDAKRENKQLVIWERKQLIEITDEALPKNGEYCRPYSTIKHSAPSLTIDEVLVDEDEVDDDVENPAVDVSIVDEDDEEPIIKENDSEFEPEPKKSKGGRPKGAKNKSKRGRKPAKRPYNKKSTGTDK